MLEGDLRVQQRAAAVERLLRAVCDAKEFPWFVSDEATLLDVCTSSEADILARVGQAFGLAMNPNMLKLPVWRLVEELNIRSV